MNAKQHSRLRVLLVTFSLCICATACASDSEVDTGSPSTVADGSEGEASADPAQLLADARQKWADNGPATYVMTTKLICFCPEIAWKNTVIDGQVAEIVSVGPEGFIEPRTQTMETLFDEVDTTIREGYETLNLEFDDDTGALIGYWVDVDARIADEEHGVEISVSPMIEETTTADTVAAE